ncbi:MAG: PH domain-containing protein [Actinomycetia bacterium]|nr:PH domain-containing protein [Actinomycetes bacterium]
MGLKDRHLTEGERVIRTMRTHIKALVPALLWAVFLIIMLVVVGRLFSGREAYDVTMLGARIIAALLALWLVVWPVLNWFTARFTITNRRVSHRHGVITRKGRDIPLHRVNDIAIERGLLDRMLGCGTLVVSDATQQHGMILHDVPSVEKVAVELQQLLYTHDDGSDDGEFPPNEPERPRGQQPRASAGE